MKASGSTIAVSAFSRDSLGALPLRSIQDVLELERTPLAERLSCSNFARRIRSGLEARAPTDTAIHYIEDGRIESQAKTYSFGELLGHIDRVSALFRSSGIGPDDVVAILLPTVPQLYWSVIAAMSSCIAFPINWMLEPRHLFHLIEESRAKAVIALGPTPHYSIWEAVGSFAGELSTVENRWSVPGPGGSVLPDSDLDTLSAMQDPASVRAASTVLSEDIVAYLHSGGTTGLPKIIKLSHAGMSHRQWTQTHALQQEFGEVVLHDTPMFHSGGLCARSLPPMAAGASVVVPSPLGARDKTYMKDYWKFIEKYRVTRLSGVPTSLGVLAKNPPKNEDLSSLKPFFITGSAPMPVAVRKEFQRATGIRILNSYGMTENTGSIAIDPRDGPSKDGASGIRVPYTNIRVVRRDEDNRLVRECAPDEIGAIEIRGAGLTPGYLNPEHQTRAHTEDGWLVTGDLGRLDEDGYVFVTGRAKDLIIRGGHNIDPELIEEPLLALPGVLHAAAVGKPDTYAGELPIAYVQLVPESTLTSEDIVAHLRATVSERAAIPKEVVIMDELPLTTIGKPSKIALRNDAAIRAYGAALSEATGLQNETSVRVGIEPHPVHGTMVRVELSCADHHAQPGLREKVRNVLDAYAAKYDIVWRTE